jgi:Na+/H+-dicarboxylate symporter
MNKLQILKVLKTNLLTILTVVAVILSIITGIVLKGISGPYSPRVIMYVNFLGDLFLRMIRALILPLIISSLIAAVAPLDISLSKKIGSRAIIYILLTTVFAVCLGIVLVVTINPGGGGIAGEKKGDGTKGSGGNLIVDTLLDLVR